MLPRFYRTEEEFQRLHLRLKLSPCPHCKRTGALILHGHLYGYAEGSACLKASRGRRVLCNNRKARHNGCGRTFSALRANRLRRLRLGAPSLWAFLTLVLLLGNRAEALRRLALDLSRSSAGRLWKRFLHAQSRIRAALLPRVTPPALPHARQSAAQTLAHLQAAFHGDPCPIAAFQHQLQRAFL